ncbi:hypothetical protein ID866_10160 [Astraeus odoratus]|nr:hypothetical protein ID866_10160 [Astraeus odoratus]
MLRLVLYDIPSKVQSVYWSSNTLRSRLTLSCKGLPFKAEWVEYHDIAARMKKMGEAPSKRLDGSGLYTLPVLRDANTDAVITDSWEIAEYRERPYPEKSIFANYTKALICVYDVANVRQIR